MNFVKNSLSADISHVLIDLLLFLGIHDGLTILEDIGIKVLRKLMIEPNFQI